MDADRPAHEAERLLEEIEFELRQWFCGDYEDRETAERIYALFAGYGIPTIPAKKGDIS